jgi:glycosyltransferase involved in cell wall biosynthesis
MEIIKLDSLNKIPIGTVIIVRDRLDLTKITIESYLFTTTLDYRLLIVDNASGPETQEYLNSLDLNVIRFDENKYPGYALNYGWDALVSEFPNIEFLHRSDNDIFYRAGWDRYAVETMRAFTDVGQFGCLDLSDYFPFGMKPIHFREFNGCQINAHPYDIGGSFLLRRKVWDQGVRHNEKPWLPIDSAGGVSGGSDPTIKMQGNQPEDKLFMYDVIAAGWKTGHTIEPINYHLGVGYGWLKNNPNFSYYKKSFEDRGIDSFEDYINNARMAKVAVEEILNEEDRQAKVEKFLDHNF